MQKCATAKCLATCRAGDKRPNCNSISMQPPPPTASSPIGARRVKTDLQTSEHVFIQQQQQHNRSRSSSPMVVGPVRPGHHRNHFATSGTASPRITITSCCSPSPNRIRSHSSALPAGHSAGTVPKSPSRGSTPTPGMTRFAEASSNY